MFGILKALGSVLSSVAGRASRKNKWAGLDRGPGYRIEDLGRPAVFYLPEEALTHRINGMSVEDIIVRFLADEYAGFSCDTRKRFGVWRDGRQIIHYDTCTAFEVSFIGKERIPLLVSLLAFIAEHIGEQCIYFKAGQYSALIWPTG